MNRLDRQLPRHHPWLFTSVLCAGTRRLSATQPSETVAQTPHRAIITGGVLGIATIYSDGIINLQGMTLTAAMITMAVFSAIVMYIMSMLSLFRLRRTAPEMERSFRAPGYPIVPDIALLLSMVCLLAML